MITLKAESGTVTIGDFGGRPPTRTTWGDRWKTPDAGIPLHMYDPSVISPLAIWKTQPAVRRVVSYAAKQFASLPWHAYQRVSDTDRQRLQGSKIERMLKRPIKLQTGFSLMQILCIDKLMYDRWCLLFLPDDESPDGGKLLRISPSLLDIESNWLGEVTDVFILNPTPGEKDIRITDAPMAISWGWSGEYAGGISPLQTIRELLAENRRAVQWRSTQWEDHPKFSGILKHPGEFKSDAQRTRLQQDWTDWKTNPRSTPILEKGLEYEQLDQGATAKDTMDLEGRKLTDEEVASIFHVPPELVGIREGTYSNIKAINQMLFGPVLGPTITEFTQAINQGIVSAVDRTKDLYVEIDRESAMAGGFLEQAQMFSTMTGGPVMTVSEARARLNLRHLEGTDELITPLNVTVGGQASPQDSGEQNRKPGTDPEEES